jgi:hypothetical protein
MKENHTSHGKYIRRATRNGGFVSAKAMAITALLQLVLPSHDDPHGWVVRSTPLFERHRSIWWFEARALRAALGHRDW